MMPKALRLSVTPVSGTLAVLMQLAFDNSYARDLPGFYVAWQPTTVPTPRLVT